MGMYTEIHFNSELKKDTSAQIIETLMYMIGDRDAEPTLPAHELFLSDRWRYMLQSDSFYFDADTHSTLRFDDISNSYYLCIRSNLKNYNNEIGRFIDWIMPYLAKYDGDFLGFSRYEEEQEPTLIYFKEGLWPEKT